MARPPKVGLDYFSFDVYSDDKIKLIEAEFGLIGFAVVVKLWQKIYAGRGYYCEFDEEVALLFAEETRLGGNAVSEIVRAAIKRGIFDKTLYDKYKVLTSHGIQKRYMEGTERRVRVDVEKEYLLLSEPEIPENVYINGVPAHINSENDDRNAQSKEEESRQDKSKQKESKKEEKNSADPDKKYISFGSFGNVKLTEKEFNELKAEFGDGIVQMYISRMDSYCEASHKSYGDYCAVTLKKWIYDDRTKPGNVRASKFNNYTDPDKTDYAALEEELLNRVDEEYKEE